jgi:hypothetical protein
MDFKVGLTYNLKRQSSADEALPEDFFAEFDNEETVNAMADALKKGGCKVTKSSSTSLRDYMGKAEGLISQLCLRCWKSHSLVLDL